MARKRDDTVKLVLRLPPKLHRQLTRAAARNNQSLNSEMIQRLEISAGGPYWLAAMALRRAFEIAHGAEEHDDKELAEAARMLHSAGDLIQSTHGEKK